MPRPKIKKRPRSRAPLSRKNANKAELAQDQRVSIRTVDQWIHDKKIPYRKLARRMVRFDLDEVAKALDRFTVREIQ
jgi:excisionase family DNA binding protein